MQLLEWARPALTAAALCILPSTASSGALAVPAPKDGRARPLLVVVVANNSGTETTDFIVPFAVLKESGAADVLTVAMQPGAVKLMPALRVRADSTAAQFDATVPAGADIVIVPAMHDPADPALVGWVRAQAAKGALVMAICEGAWVLAHAGLLDGKAATTHWYALDKIARRFPATRWVRNRRYVGDGMVMTMAGVSASIPASLALVEAIAGRERAHATAARLGIAQYGAEHDSTFSLSAGRMLVAAINWLALWRHEEVKIAVADGCDELALAADAWSRTYRSNAHAVGPKDGVHSRHGLRIDTEAHGNRYLLPAYGGAPAKAIDTALDAIALRYGARTADFVALQLEYPRPGSLR